MSIKAVKLAISLPKDVVAEIESLRHKLDISRSQVVLEGVSLWLKKRQEEAMIKKYIRGYKNKPENVEERDALLKASLSGSSRDSW